MAGEFNSDRLLSRREVEATFGLSVRYLEVSGSRGDGPPMIRVGRMVRYRVGDVRNWIAEHRVEGVLPDGPA